MRIVVISYNRVDYSTLHCLRVLMRFFQKSRLHSIEMHITYVPDIIIIIVYFAEAATY